MSYIHLFDIYKHIDQRLELIEKSVKENPTDPDQVMYLNGRQSVLQEVKHFFEEQMNPRLPRAIAKKLKNRAS